MANGVIIRSDCPIIWNSVSASLEYGIKDGIVYVRVIVPQNAGEVNTQLGTLPVEARPSIEFYQSLFYRPSNGMSASIYISPSGGHVVCVANNTSGASIEGMLSYPQVQ